jgi:hypothetical protein
MSIVTPHEETLPQAIVDLAHLTGKTPQEIMQMYTGARDLLNLCHEMSVRGGWWNDLKTGERLDRNKGELLCLIHSEISEAMEGERKNLQDDKLPHRKMAEVELADALVRCGDYGGGFGYNIAGAMIEKIVFNNSRPDHKPENRAAAGGKAF